jgi:hypothetical protein
MLFKTNPFHVCAFEEEINKKKHFLFCMDIDCPPIEGDMIIPLYTNSLTLQRQSDIFVVYH